MIEFGALLAVSIGAYAGTPIWVTVPLATVVLLLKSWQGYEPHLEKVKEAGAQRVLIAFLWMSLANVVSVAAAAHVVGAIVGMAL